MEKTSDHAVVFGSGLAGLLAARVLSDAYGRVTVIERDSLPDSPDNRNGVPQDRHTHGLLARGSQILGELFPGMLDEFEAAGAQVVRDYAEFPFAPSGQWLSPEMRPGEPSYLSTRPFLEHHVRVRVRALPNVEFVDECDAVGLVTTEDRDRVVGARIHRRDREGGEERLDADLVVDAMGRAARTPAWLADLGYKRPQEEQLPLRVTYATQRLRLRPGALKEKSIIVGAEPGRPFGAGLVRQEDDVWLLTIYGCVGHQPPADAEARLELLAECMPAHVVSAIREAEQLAETATFRYPANRRRRYDKLRSFPAGLLVVGDALCSFNPIYGQGMTVAALQSLALRDCLLRGKHDLARRFFRTAASPIGVAWQLAAGSDLALPELEAPRPLSVRVLNSYVGRLQAAASTDAVLATQFIRVAFLLDPPARLFRPGIVLRVLTPRRSRPAEASAARASLDTAP